MEQGWIWAMTEVAQGVGMLEVGRAPPFPDGAAQVAETGRAVGVVAQTGVRVSLGGSTTLGVKARYDRYDRRYDEGPARRVFHTGTFGVEVDPVPAVRLQVNVELRDLVAPEGTPEAVVIAESMGHRVTAQGTVSF